MHLLLRVDFLELLLACGLSIRQHTSAYVSICQHTSAELPLACGHSGPSSDVCLALVLGEIGLARRVVLLLSALLLSCQYLYFCASK